jgi:hypothetical protein
MWRKKPGMTKQLHIQVLKSQIFQTFQNFKLFRINIAL